MSTKNGVWHSAALDLPRADDINTTVLIVKQNKNGEKVVTFGKFISSCYKPIGGRWEGYWSTNNGKGDVLYWMPLPKIPD